MVTSRLLLPVLVLCLPLAACGDGEGDGDPAGAVPAPTTTSSPAAPPAEPSATPPAVASPAVASPDTQALALYWLGAADEPRGPRLYREFVRLQVGADAVRTAVEAMLAREPADPDHLSLWADGTTVREVRRDGSTAVVDLSRQARENGGGSAAEAMTLQQLVHTATAADPSVTAVSLRVEGRPVETLWGTADASGPLRRAPSAEVLGPVWIDHAEGETVGRVVRGTATVFEATVSWDVQRAGVTVQEGFSTATEGGPGRGTWTAELDVPAGTYVLRAWESSAEDGAVTWLETRTVRVIP